MLDMIRLLHGNNKYSYKEFEKFKPLDTICGDASAPDEIKTWSEKDFEYDFDEMQEAAMEELEGKFCSATYLDKLIEVDEWSLEFYTADENGEFIEGSDYEPAPMRYKVNYNTGAGDEDAYSLEEAKKLAELGICYTQKSIDIFDREKEEIIATLPWSGVQAGDDDDPFEEIGGGFLAVFFCAFLLSFCNQLVIMLYTILLPVCHQSVIVLFPKCNIDKIRLDKVRKDKYIYSRADSPTPHQDL